MKLKEALINNGSAADEEEADEIIEELTEELQEKVMSGDLNGADEILYQYGLEPDYLDELLGRLL
jgi:hypothetical protein